MKKKLWLVAGLLALVCTVYYFASEDGTPSVPAHPEHVINTPTPSDTAGPELQSDAGPASARSTQPPAAPGNTASTSTPQRLVPAPTSEPGDTPDARVQLWQMPEADASVSIDGIPGVRLQVNPNHLRQLRLGQTLLLDIPGNHSTIEAELTDTYNDPGGVQVWQGHIDGEVDEAAVIITRGKSHTHLVIASENGNYSVVIDNQSGESTFIDEGDINERQAPIDDGIYVDPPDSVPLPSIQ